MSYSLLWSLVSVWDIDVICSLQLAGSEAAKRLLMFVYKCVLEQEISLLKSLSLPLHASVPISLCEDSAKTGSKTI